MLQVTVVDTITVHVTTGDTCYPGENGFSAIWAEIRTSDPAVSAQLGRVALASQMVTVRCAMIDVIGTVSRQEQIGTECLFVISVNHLTYRSTSDAATGA